MREDVARAILRLIATTAMLVGAILSTISAIQWSTAEPGPRQYATYLPQVASGVFGPAGRTDLIACSSILLFGGLLFSMSRRMARLIAT